MNTDDAKKFKSEAGVITKCSTTERIKENDCIRLWLLPENRKVTPRFRVSPEFIISRTDDLRQVIRRYGVRPEI
jgi:hypothetical protein